eukprot:Skav206048  [mRNA]  locus=scaffold587:251628:252893:- [translate_table: standard]
MPNFETLAVGLVPDRQYAGRGELCAFVVALRAANRLPATHRVSFVTDALYIFRIIHNIKTGYLLTRGHTFANADLLPEIIALWDNNRFSLIKIKSHRSFDSAKDHFDLFLIAGNFFADKAATASLQASHDVWNTSNEIAKFNSRERKAIADYFNFLVDLNATQMDLAKNQTLSGDNADDHVERIMPRDLNHDDAAVFLQQFRPEHYQCLSFPQPEIKFFQAMQCGANLARMVFHWATTLAWPQHISDDYRSFDDWGISWLELTVSFLIASQKYFPIPLEGRGYEKTYAEYMSDEALLCPPHKRAVFQQSAFLQRTIQCLQTLTQVPFFPKFDLNKCASMQRLGYLGQPPAGIPCRPVLPNAEATIECVKNYFSNQGSTKHSMNQPIKIPQIPSILHFEDVLDELSMKERYRSYQYLYRQVK